MLNLVQMKRAMNLIPKKERRGLYEVGRCLDLEDVEEDMIFVNSVGKIVRIKSVHRELKIETIHTTYHCNHLAHRFTNIYREVTEEVEERL